MGKGGSAKASPVARLGPLAATVPEPSKDITKGSIRAAIPAHLFKRSYVHSLGHLALDLVWVAATCLLAVHAASMLPSVFAPLVWGAYWFYQGINCTALWVLAHECGHGGFTDSRLVNDAVGFLLHSALLTPYFSWAMTCAAPALGGGAQQPGGAITLAAAALDPARAASVTARKAA
jgi:omega-6 fatty acid desaturase (delta-12 desaturase)